MEPMSRSALLALKSDEDAKYRRQTISHAVTAFYTAAVLMAKQTHTTAYKRRITDEKDMIPEIVEELRKLFPDSVVKKTRRGYVDGKAFEVEASPGEKDMKIEWHVNGKVFEVASLSGEDYITIDWT
jgi:phosphoribosylaminoimidazole carboxylase (NCAIR synthetase)